MRKNLELLNSDVRDKILAEDFDEIYIHFGHGGILFKVEDSEFSPTLIIESSNLGQQTQRMSIHLDNEHLFILSKLFDNLSKKQYKGEYWSCSENSVHFEKNNKTIGEVYFYGAFHESDNRNTILYKERQDK